MAVKRENVCCTYVRVRQTEKRRAVKSPHTTCAVTVFCSELQPRKLSHAPPPSPLVSGATCFMIPPTRQVSLGTWQPCRTIEPTQISDLSLSHLGRVQDPLKLGPGEDERGRLAALITLRHDQAPDRIPCYDLKQRNHDGQF